MAFPVRISVSFSVRSYSRLILGGGGGGGGVSNEGGGRGSLLLLDDCHTNAGEGREETHNKGDGRGGGFGRRINTNLSSGVGQKVCAFESCQRRLSPKSVARINYESNQNFAFEKR